MTRRALIIGIDDYSTQPLEGCVNDAIAIANTLEKHGNGDPNFDVRALTSNNAPINTSDIQDALEELFASDADTVLFYFAGHGIINPTTNVGYIVSQDGKHASWGVSLNDILTMANDSYPRIKSSVIVLDCCRSGALGEAPSIKEGASIIGNGVTILTACHKAGVAKETPDNHGLFTSILLDGLQGGSADILGRVTPASLYAHVDQTLGAWEQRPIYKANVQQFIELRTVAPKVAPEILRNLPIHFPSPEDHFNLDPSFEEDRTNVDPKDKLPPVNPDNVKVFKELQKCNRYGLVVPVDEEHMYYAAMHSTSCKLTALGAHYRNLAELKHI